MAVTIQKADPLQSIALDDPLRARLLIAQDNTADPLKRREALSYIVGARKLTRDPVLQRHLTQVIHDVQRSLNNEAPHDDDSHSSSL